MSAKPSKKLVETDLRKLARLVEARVAATKRYTDGAAIIRDELESVVRESAQIAMDTLASLPCSSHDPMDIGEAILTKFGLTAKAAPCGEKGR